MKTAIILLSSMLLLCVGCNTLDKGPDEKPGQESGQGSGSEVSNEGKSLEQLRKEAFEKIDVKACEDNGGTVRQEGILGFPRCTTPYSDAGNRCSDASDCQGRCFGKDGVTNFDTDKGETVGVCEANDSPFGCYSEIINGTPTPMICVD